MASSAKLCFSFSKSSQVKSQPRFCGSSKFLFLGEKFKNADYISSSLSLGSDLCPKIELTFRRNAAERYFSVYLLEPAATAAPSAPAAPAAVAAAAKTFQILILTILSQESVNSTWCLWCNASKFTYSSLFFFLLSSWAIWYSEEENTKRTTCRYKNNVNWDLSHCGYNL